MRALVLALFLAMMMQSPALAHRVNIFAYVEGSEVLVECAFSRSNPVRQGLISVFDAGSGEELLQGKTDDQGFFRFPIPEKARTAGSGLRIRIQAGEGHQNEWMVEAQELNQAAESAPIASSEVSTPAAPPEVTTKETHDTPPAGLTKADVEAVVNAALDAKLAPIKRAVLEKSGPGLVEILGGIGWILGLAGVAAYFRSRPRA